MKLAIYMDNSRKNRLLKKTTLKIDFGCEIYAIFKKGINGNQSTMWQVEVNPHHDGCTKFSFFSNISYKLTFTTK
jgi:hypothetical protein